MKPNEIVKDLKRIEQPILPSHAVVKQTNNYPPIHDLYIYGLCAVVDTSYNI